MTGPEGEMTAGAAARGRLRASDADREQAIDTLKAAFVHGQLTKDELGMRVGQALVSRTYADLAVLTADIPAMTAAAQLSLVLARARARESMAARVKVVAWSACVIILLAGLLATAGTGNSAWLILSMLEVMAAAVPASCATLEVAARKRSRGQLPQGPARGAGVA